MALRNMKLLSALAGLTLVCIGSFCPSKAFANDGAMEVAAGGLRFRHEDRISIQQEHLYISLTFVRVEMSS